MTSTEKFSQFPGPSPIQAGDIVVGLRTVGGSPVNYQFTGVGTGGGGAVTTTIVQAAPALAIGNWVRINSAGSYVAALADNAGDGEVIGVVVGSPANGQPANTYVIQQSGYVPASEAVFSGLGTPGQVWFLDTATPGNMVANDATVNGQVSRPVFVNDTATSGWVVPYRGLIVGGGSSSTTTPGTSPEIVTVTQNGHGFSAGQWLTISTPNLVTMQPTYILACANTLQNSQGVGVVTAVNNANQFVIQFSGYVTGAGCPTVDETGAPLQPSAVYYISDNPVFAGRLTGIPPTAATSYTKPAFMSEQSMLTTGTNAGYILPQRPNAVDFTTQNTRNITQNNTFVPGNWLYISADNTYALAIANSLASSQVAGVVTSATASQFTIQFCGFIDGVVTQDYLGNPLVSAEVYYLSATVAGAIVNASPVGAGFYSKPCYVQQTLATFTGEILPQRPLSSGSLGPSQLVQFVYTSVNTVSSIPIPANVWTNITPMVATIAPISAANIIKLSCMFGYSSVQSGGRRYFRFLRNGVTPVGVGAGLPIQSTLSITSSFSEDFLIVDSPASTAPQTYQLQYLSTAGDTITVCADNTMVASYYSQLILEEIG